MLSTVTFMKCLSNASIMQFYPNSVDYLYAIAFFNSSTARPDSSIAWSFNYRNSTASPPSLSRDEDLAKVEMAVLAAIFVLAVLGNASVLCVLRATARHKKLSRMNSMIIHLTIADLFVGFFHVLPQLAWKGTFHFYGGRYLCKLVTYGQLVGMFAASYVLVTTAIDRYVAICHPLEVHFWGQRRMRCLVGAAWFVSFLFALPQMFIFSYGPHPAAPQINDCIGAFEPSWTLPVYVTWVTMSIYLLPLIILIIIYTRICMTVWRSASVNKAKVREITESPLMRSSGPRYSRNPRAHVRAISQAKVKTVKLTLVVIANYVFCYGPFFISQMWAAWDETAPFEGKAMVIIMLLASLTSCTNPWIYLAFNDRFSIVISGCFIQFHLRSLTHSTMDSSYSRSTHVQSIGTIRLSRTHSTIRGKANDDGESEVATSPTATATPLDADGVTCSAFSAGTEKTSTVERIRSQEQESVTRF